MLKCRLAEANELDPQPTTADCAELAVAEPDPAAE